VHYSTLLHTDNLAQSSRPDLRSLNPDSGQNPLAQYSLSTPTAHWASAGTRSCQWVAFCQAQPTRSAIASSPPRHYGGGKVSLIPQRDSDRSRWLEWSFFIAMELNAASLYIIRRHAGLKDVYGSAPAAIDAAKTYFLKQLTHVEQELCVGGPFLMGGQFTTADILLTTCLDWAMAVEVPLPASCGSYLERTASRDAYRAAATANAKKL
jgi:Glutathione S-transferase, C-terminal domain